MEVIPNDLAAAALAARERLSTQARRAAADGASGSPGGRTAMAGVAREAIFADALLSAMHARLEEVKNAAK